MTRTAISPRLAIRIFFSTGANVGGVTRTPGIDVPDESPQPWTVSVVSVTGSTNSDLLSAAEQGELVDRSVLRTDHQTSGRGRLDRRWDAPPGSNLLASIYLAEPGDRPALAVQRVGVAIVEAVRGLVAARPSDQPDLPGVVAPSIGLKWPNDVLLDGRKLAGILAQRSSSVRGLVVGFGVNVGWAPTDAARVGEVVECRPDQVLDAVLRAFDALPVDDEVFAERYRRNLLTLGQRVRIHLPGESTFDGTATDIDGDGRIIVCSPAGVEQTFDVGDIVHLRPDPAT